METTVDKIPLETERKKHIIRRGDARNLIWIPDESIHLIVTSPPYWTLKKYNDNPSQLGAVSDYEDFLNQLDSVWEHAHRILVPGGRLICVVGDVLLSRRQNKGRHHVIPLHADISVRCRKLGLDYLTPILWHKIANANYEVSNGSSFLGKPYEPNAIIKSNLEYILMFRKPGGYRSPTTEQRIASKLTKDQFNTWFRSFWSDIPGASTKNHPAPFPVDLAERLIRMFSFVGDTVLDPFCGTGTTVIASLKSGRNSLGVEIDPEYLDFAHKRIQSEMQKQDFLDSSPAPQLIYIPENRDS